MNEFEDALHGAQCSTASPAGWIDGYERAAQANERRMACLATLLHTSSALTLVPLAGADLYLRGAYQRLGERRMSDIDLLVAPTHQDALAAALSAQGFQLRPHAAGFWTEGFVNDSVDFVSDDREIGWDIVSEAPHPACAGWPERRVERTSRWGTFWLLAPEDALTAMLFKTVALRGRLSPKLVNDLRAFLRVEAGAIRWDVWIQTTASAPGRSALARAIRYVDAAAAGLWPESVTRAFASRGLGDRVQAWYWDRAVRETAPPVRYLFPLASMPGWAAKKGALLRAIWPASARVSRRSGLRSWRDRVLRRLLKPVQLVFKALLVLPRELFFLFRK